MHKKAVDAKSKEYWDSYFKEYGKSWTRDIPRRMKQAVRREVEASKIEGLFKPLAKHVNDDNSLSLEAAFIGKLDDQDAKVLITAEFNSNGVMQEFEATRIV